MLRNRLWLFALAVTCMVLHGAVARANINVSEDFTGTQTDNSWYFFNGACLTASTASADSDPGSPPGCTADGAYYKLQNSNEVLDGGYNGTASGYVSFGSSTALDPVGEGALRFTNGCMNSRNHACYDDPGGGGHSENGAIISADSFSTTQGLDITFKTVTYRGDSGGNGSSGSAHQNDGADGMSFFLIDGSVQPNIGSWGGSLAYTCSNTNRDYHGMIGAYIGLGIDEYGNFLNGSSNTLGVSNPQSMGDNTASGGGQYANRIGLRGAGSINWTSLNGAYGTDPGSSTLPYYPASLATSCQVYGGSYDSASGLCVQYGSYGQVTASNPTDAMVAVRNTCYHGELYNYDDATSPTKAGTTTLGNAGNTAGILDYQAIPNAYTVIANKIANEYSSGGYSRQKADPITYRLQITENGLLSLWYSYNGGSWIGVIANHDITADNGPLPATVRFGFAGSTGGSSNIHELLCFKATPASQAASSSTANQEQSAQVQNGSQVYFSYYDPEDWTGRLTANSLLTDSSGNLTIDSTANWDASCVLTGVAAGATCPTTGQAGAIAAEAPSSRVMLTWGSTGGVPLEWSDLSTAEQDDLDSVQGSSGLTYDTTVGPERLDYLRGDRTNEITTSGGGLFRDRDSVLGDIVDSSPAWVGPPSKSIYTAYETPGTWKDKLYPSVTMPENSGQSYTQYVATEATRLNVVYVGANDGLLHGFAAGSFDSTGQIYDSSANTGEEVLAYMPQSVLQYIHSASYSSIDYSNPQYGHNFYVDASPGTGDLYYDNAWHTWLVSGVGPGNTAVPWASQGACSSTGTACGTAYSSTTAYSAGATVSENGVNYVANTATQGEDPATNSGPGGAEIFALDVTDPTKFSESNAASLVIGDWTPSNLTCVNVSGCGQDLGDTYGTPVIRRLHNGDWGIIFGNGIDSASGDAGIYVMTVDPATAAISTYYLSTGQSGKNDGIAYVYPVDMDGDHVTDYVYAGDVNGNVWRFDLTSNSASNWAVSPGPIFTTPAGQPITTLVQPDFVTGPTGATMLMLYFGTGEKFPVTNSAATSYQSGTQAFYGVWDWNMSGWNSLGQTQFASLSASAAAAAGLSSSYAATVANLEQQSVTIDSTTGDRLVTGVNSFCWAGETNCSSSNTNKFGWYIDFPGDNSGYNQSTSEQLIFNPEIISTAVVFNSFLPGIDSPLACSAGKDEGWLYALDVLTGGPVTSTSGGTTTSFFVNNGNVHTIAFETDSSGTPTEVTTAGSGGGGTKAYLVDQSLSGGAATPVPIQPPNDVSGSRLTWVQLR